MTKTTYGRPTPAELEILDVLWEKGEATVGEVHKAIVRRQPIAYTTMLKLMQIMHEKGLVKRDEKGKAHIYRASAQREKVQRGLVGDLIDRAFHGSAMRLVQHVLETKPANREELDAIRKMIDNAAKKEGNKK